MDERITIKIRRFNPEQDKEGRLETFEIPKGISEGMTIISAMKYIQENIDPSLAFYYSCELAKCRGCVMEVNGKATFACTEPIQNGQTVEPLSSLPVIRDVVVKFIDSEIRLDEELCIGCGACVDACPMDVYEMSETGAKAVVRTGPARARKGHAVDCIGCRRCEEACPVDAIEILRLK